MRFPKPLLRLLDPTRKLARMFHPSSVNGHGPDLDNIFKTCRDYHGDVQEMVQLLSFVNACAAYVLLTSSSRPKLESLADLRPGARVAGDDTKLRAAAEVLKAEAEAIDRETEEQRRVFENVSLQVEQMQARVNQRRTTESEQNLSDACVVLKRVSSAYVAARHNAFIKYSARRICEKSGPDDHGERDAALTVKGTKGVDAWLNLVVSLYAMQCKGQEGGVGAGRQGDDETFKPVHVKEALAAFGKWLRELKRDADKVVGLELLTTKRMTDASKMTAADGTQPVVVVARDVLLKALGLVFGGIAARCHKTAEETAQKKARAADAKK